MKWVTFCRRTEDPKLAYLETRLTGMGIPHRRHGSSFHAPILQVPEDRHEEAYRLFDEDWDGVRLDDVPDDDESFQDCEPHNFLGET